MTDMTEWDQESYGAGYKCAEFEIQKYGIEFAESQVNHTVTENQHSWLIGYRTCVQAWKEGVRL